MTLSSHQSPSDERIDVVPASIAYLIVGEKQRLGTCSPEEARMSDFLMLMLLVAAFLGTIEYVRVCDSLVEPTDAASDAPT